MSEDTAGSTVPRRQLGRYLRDLRGKARLTVKAAAQELEWSEAKIWHIETGQTSLRSLDVEAMCRVYDAPDELTDALKDLAKETKGRGWWQAYGNVFPHSFNLYIGLEEAAADLSWYEAELVPGLFQTAAYARTVIRADNPGVDEERSSGAWRCGWPGNRSSLAKLPRPQCRWSSTRRSCAARWAAER